MKTWSAVSYFIPLDVPSSLTQMTRPAGFVCFLIIKHFCTKGVLFSFENTRVWEGGMQTSNKRDAFFITLFCV